MRVALVLTLVGAAMLTVARAAGDPIPASARAAAEGRRLAQEGRLAEAATKLAHAWAASADPEVLFDLAVCYERLGRDAEAAASFRSYVKLPLALRLRAADERARAIESRLGSDGAGATSGPRRVLVPIAGDGGNCYRDCTRKHCDGRRQMPCSPTEFVCLRTCPGARVEPGLCVTAQVRPGEKCRTASGLF